MNSDIKLFELLFNKKKSFLKKDGGNIISKFELFIKFLKNRLNIKNYYR